MYYDDAAECIRHLRSEADFNRSWTDGRRGIVTAPKVGKHDNIDGKRRADYRHRQT